MLLYTIINEGTSLYLLKKHLYFLSIFSMFVLFTGCSSGETSYSLNDLQTILQDSNLTVDRNITIDKNTNATPSVFPILNSPIMTAKVDNPLESDTYVYSISGDDSPFFNINQNGTLYFIKLPYYDKNEDKDHNNIFEVTIKVTNQKSTAVIQISVSIAEDAEHVLPAIQTSHIDIYENNNTSVQLQASSGTATALNYTLEPGYDETLFSIDESSGLLSFNTTPDFENPQDSDADNNFTLNIRVTDQTTYANTITKKITLSVLNIIGTPTDLEFTSITSSTEAANDLGHTYKIESPTALYVWWRTARISRYTATLNATASERVAPLTYTITNIVTSNSDDGVNRFILSNDGILTITIPKEDGGGKDDTYTITINTCNESACQNMDLTVRTD